MRFQFNDEWKIYKISDFLEFFTANSLSWEQLEYNSENLQNLHYGLIHKGAPTQINTDNFQLPNIGEEFIPKTYTLCQDGDVAFADASEDTNDVAKAVEFFNCNDKKIVCGLHTIHGRDKLNVTAKGFKGYAFSSASFHSQMRRLAQGTKVYSVSQKNFNECFVGIPSKEEQTKIAHLLQLIDDRISTQSKTVRELETLIKAVRFVVFKKDIYSKKQLKVRLCNVLEEYSEKNTGNNLIPVAVGKFGIRKREDIYSKDLSDDYSKNKVIMKDTLVIGMGSTQIDIGILLTDDKYCVSPAYTTYKIKNIFAKYLEEYLSFINSLLSKRYMITSVRQGKSVNKTELLNHTITIHDKEEQQKIEILFHTFENYLNVEKNLLLAYQQQKKYLLQQMFI